MHFLILADIALVIFSILVTIRVIQFIAPWDVLGAFLYLTFIPAFEFCTFAISCLLFYMSFDYNKLKRTYSFLLYKKKDQSIQAQTQSTLNLVKDSSNLDGKHSDSNASL